MAITVTSGQSATVLPGTTQAGTTVDEGGMLTVDAGGSVTGTFLSNGGTEDVFGTDTGLTASSNYPNIAFQIVEAGGVADGGAFGVFALQLVNSGGLTSGAKVYGALDPNDEGGLYSNEIINEGGVASGTVLSMGGLQTLNGSAVNTSGVGRGNAIALRGVLTYSGTNTTVSAAIDGAGLLQVAGASTRVGISDANQGFFNDRFEGLAMVGANTELELDQSDALGSGTIVFSHNGGGTLSIDSNVTPTETIGDFYSGNQIVVAGQISAAQVGDDLVQLFYADGTEDDIRILGARTGGIAITTGNGNTVLTSDLVATSVDFGDDATIVDDQGYYTVQDGGTVTVQGGGTLTDGSVGGSDDSNAAPAAVPSAARFAAADAAPTSALLTIAASGSATNTVVISGGVEDVQSGGTTYNDQIFFSGEQIVESGGASYDPVFHGGTLVADGLVAYGLTSSSPASATIATLSGSGTITEAGGALLLSGDASAFSGTIFLSAGSVEIGAAANLGSGSIAFADIGDPTLQFDATLGNLSAAAVSGFSTPLDIIDLRGVGYSGNTAATPFASYEQAAVVASGGTATLNVTSAGASGALTLDPATTGSGPVNFYDDGSGGTDVQFSTLSAGSLGDLTSAIDQAATLSSGAYTVFLSSGFDLTSAPDAIQALNGATVVLDGEGYALMSGAITASAGPVVVQHLGGSVGLVAAGGAHVAVTSNTFSGDVEIASGTMEVVDQFGAGAGKLVFDGSGSEALLIDAGVIAADGGTFSNTLDGFGGAAQEYVDLAGFTFSSGQTSATSDGAGITVSNGATTAVLATIGGGSAFNVFDDGQGGTILTADSVACYVTGTLIRTAEGDRPVQTLAIGQLVATAAGALRPVRWIGHRRYHGRFVAGRRDMLPVCIRAGALAEGVPARDLFVSPKHAMFIDGVLAPAEALVNGASVVQLRQVDEIGYWHVELATHDVLLAEGAPSESFVDDGSRGMFPNCHEFAARYPHAPEQQARYCAPRVESGMALEAIRRRLAARARLDGRLALAV